MSATVNITYSILHHLYSLALSETSMPSKCQMHTGRGAGRGAAPMPVVAEPAAVPQPAAAAEPGGEDFSAALEDLPGLEEMSNLEDDSEDDSYQMQP